MNLKNLTLKENPQFCSIFKKKSLASEGGGAQALPLIKCNCLFTCTSGLIEGEKFGE